MKPQKPPILPALLLWLGCIWLLPNALSHAQSLTDEKPKRKNFGSSLNPKKEKNKNQPQQNSEGENADQENDDEVIKVETNLVKSDVLVIDRKGNAILGLKKDDFVVTENNISQEIGVFELGDSTEVPRSIVLIMDNSGSQIPYVRTSVEAAKVLVDKLNPRDRMAIVTDDVELLVDFTSDKKLLKRKLNSLLNSPVGKSLQYSALMAVLNEMFDEEDVRPIIIFQTDGDQGYFIPRESDKRKKDFDKHSSEPGFTITDLFNAVEKSRATIYSIISGPPLLGISPEERAKKKISEKMYYDQKSMSLVAQASGGFTEILVKPEQADEVYSRIFNSITNRYLIGYYPTELRRDGVRRTVKIEVRGHPEYVVWGRKTYFAPLPQK